MASAILCVYWMLYVGFCGFYGVVHISNIKLPQVIKDIVLFGKAKAKKRKWTAIQLLEIPKGWFTHFYIIGTVLNGYVTYICLTSYVLGQRPPSWIIYALDSVTSGPWIVSTGAGSAILLILLMFLQNTRRLYECLFISVYSKSTMNVLHYIMGMSLYTLFHLSVLCESPNLLTARVHDVRDELLQLKHLIGIVIFLMASWQQHFIHREFANMRKNSDGTVQTFQHKIPHGGWFEYVSCPHYFMEVLIYFAFTIIAGPGHITLGAVFLFVLANQFVSAAMAHRWYKATYQGYPRDRKALIPFVL